MKMESITRKWWFFLLLILLQFIPPYTSVQIDPSQIGLVIGEALSNAILYDFQLVYPLFKIIPILLILAIPLFRNRVSRIFSFYVAISYVLFAILQSIAITEDYGLLIVTTNLVMFFFVASTWFWEALVQKNSFLAPRLTPSTIWVIPLAILAFWYPLNGNTMMPEFNPITIITNAAGLTFCMMTPVYLSILIIYYPDVNIATLRATSVIGIIIGFYNFLLNFVWYYELLFWNGVLHIPLIVLSIYAFILSFRKTTEMATGEDARQQQD